MNPIQFCVSCVIKWTAYFPPPPVPSSLLPDLQAHITVWSEVSCNFPPTTSLALSLSLSLIYRSIMFLLIISIPLSSSVKGLKMIGLEEKTMVVLGLWARKTLDGPIIEQIYLFWQLEEREAITEIL